MIDFDTAIQTRLERMVPAPGAPDWGSIAMAARRSTWRRVLATAATAVVALLGATTARGLIGTTDRSYTVASGSDWSLVAHRSHGRLCLAYGGPGTAVSGCNLDGRHAFSVFAVMPASNTRSRIVGIVAPNVSRVEVTPSGRRPIVLPLHSMPAELASSLRAFVIDTPLLLPPETAKRLKLTAYASSGAVLHSISL